MRAVRESYRAVVPAVVTSAAILVLGFGVSLLSAVPSVRMFGGLSCLALTLAMLGDLFMLPAILISLRRPLESGTRWSNRKSATQNP